MERVSCPFTQKHHRVNVASVWLVCVAGTGKLGFSFVRITALVVSCNRLWVGTGNGVIISIPLSEGASTLSWEGAARPPAASAALTRLFPAANKTLGGAPNRPGTAVRVFADDASECGMKGSAVPYCSMAHAQLCFHGHRNAVKFFVTVPGKGSWDARRSCCRLSEQPKQMSVPSPTGHALPPPGAADSGSDDPPSESSDTADPKTYLVMSGGEGYIDFRLGECIASGG